MRRAGEPNFAEKNVPVIIVTGHSPRKLLDRIYDDFGGFERSANFSLQS